MTRMFPNEIPFFQPDKRRKEDAFSRMLRQNVQVQLIRQSVEQQTFYQIQCIGSNFCKVGYVCIVLFSPIAGKARRYLWDSNKSVSFP